MHGWTRPDQAVRWPVRLRGPASFAVSIAYDAPATSAGGTFAVSWATSAGGHACSETPAAPVPLGRVTLPAGRFDIAVRATAIKGDELLRLRAIRLTPVP